MTCYGCGKKGHLKRRCSDNSKGYDTKDEKKADKPKSNKGKEAAEKLKASSGTLYTTVSTSETELTNTYYVYLGASQHLIPTQADLHAYWEFSKPVEIAVASGGVVYAYGSGTLRVSSSAKGLVAVLQDVYYAPGIHARLVSFGKLLHQGWTVRCLKTNMELHTEEVLLFANVEMAKNVYPVRLDIIHLQPALAAWTVEGVSMEPALDELAGHLGRVAMVATVKGPNGRRASLLTWHQQLGHSSFKTVVAPDCLGIVQIGGV